MADAGAAPPMAMTGYFCSACDPVRPNAVSVGGYRNELTPWNPVVAEILFRLSDSPDFRPWETVASTEESWQVIGSRLD